MAQLLDTVVIAVFSTSRGYYGGGRLEQLRAMDDPTVYLSAAKESGDIEFDCATILFLDVDQLVEGPAKPARAVVARCRMGSIGAAGYRARLDVGAWEPDPLAASEMSKDRKAEGKAEATEDEIRARILAEIRERPIVKEALAALIGGGAAGFRKAFARLERDEIIAAHDEQYLDGAGRARRRTVWVVNEVRASNVAQGKESP